MLPTSWPRTRTRTSATEAQSTAKPARRQTTFRPRLEALEGRDVPSALFVRSLDGGLGTQPLTLRSAIAAAQNGDTIDFDQSLFANGHQTIQLTSGQLGFGGDIELFIAKDVTIQGPGSGELTIDGGGAARAFEIAQGAHVTISGLTIQDGNGRTGAFDPSQFDNYGGGILNEGFLTLNGCMVTQNSAKGGNRFIGDGGGIANFGSMQMTGCTVAGNTADYLGGGVYNTGLLAITSSVVANNTSVFGSRYDDLVNVNGTVGIFGSTIGSKKYK